MRSHADATTLLICVEPGRLALAAAEDSAFAAELIDRLAGYDANLLHLGLLLIEECAADYPRGALFWNEAASPETSLPSRHTHSPSSIAQVHNLFHQGCHLVTRQIYKQRRSAALAERPALAA